MSAPYVSQTYRLPDGQTVSVDATAAKSAAVIDFTLADGTIVKATRVDPEPVPGDIVWVEEGKFTGCILNLLEVHKAGDNGRRRPTYVCRNDSFGGLVELGDGRIVNAILTRKVALYLTVAERTARMDGASIVGRAHAPAAKRGAA